MKKETRQQISWKQMFLFTRDGKLQSTDLMYAFFLAIGILFLNFGISNRLSVAFEHFFSEMPRSGKNALGILVPAILCALAALLLFRIIRKKKITLMAYCISMILVIVVLVILLIEFDRDTLELLLPAYTGIFVIPALAGTAAVIMQFRQWSLRNPDPLSETESASEEEQHSEAAQISPEDEISGWRQFRS